MSAQGESPKDEEQNTFTAKEEILAKRHKVEPKLVRLLNDIVYERTQILNDVIDDRTRHLSRSIDEQLELLNEFIEDRPAKTEPTASEPKETDIDQINQILKSWPKERVSFLAESLKHPPEALQEAEEQTEQEESETQDQPEKEQKAEELCINQQTQERLKSYYKNLDPRTKLAIAALTEIQALEGINFQINIPRKERLCTQIWDDLESACIETFHSKPGDVADIALGVFSSEDVWLARVWEACYMTNQCT